MRSIQSRLTLLFFSITLAAVGVVYFYVAPSLETNLRNQRLSALAVSAAQFSGPLQHALGSSVSKPVVDRQVRQAADRASLRVTLLGISRGTLGLATYTIADSQAVGGVSKLRFGVAEAAARTSHSATGTEAGPGGQVGEAAQPLFFRNKPARVAVFSAPLTDVASNGALIRRRIQEAGAIALLLAILAGYAVSRALSLRVKRLEQTAGRVAAGDFSARFPVDSEDELGQLARALDDMQHQLADLLPGRVPGADPGRGARRRDPPPVRRPGAPAGRSPGSAGHRPAGPEPAGGRLAGASPGANRPLGAGQGGGVGVHPRALPAFLPPAASAAPGADLDGLRS